MTDNFKFFLLENKISWKYTHNFEDVIVWIEFDILEKFQDLLGYTYISNNYPQCNLGDNFIIFRMKAILDYFNLDLKDIFNLDLKDIFAKELADNTVTFDFETNKYLYDNIVEML
jgi:hypothetical protein